MPHLKNEYHIVWMNRSLPVTAPQGESRATRVIRTVRLGKAKAAPQMFQRRDVYAGV